MKYTYTQRDIGKLLKKVIRKNIIDVLPIEMAKNCVPGVITGSFFSFQQQFHSIQF
jgi:hypothetical protein